MFIINFIPVVVKLAFASAAMVGGIIGADYVIDNHEVIGDKYVVQAPVNPLED